MAVIGETKVRLFRGEKYTFKRIDKECWKCVDQDASIIPASIIEEFETPTTTLIGRKVTKFWEGQKFVFERVAKGVWECIYQDSDYIPNAHLDEINSLN